MQLCLNQNKLIELILSHNSVIIGTQKSGNMTGSVAPSSVSNPDNAVNSIDRNENLVIGRGKSRFLVAHQD